MGKNTGARATKILFKLRYVIMLAWLVVLCCGGVFGADYMANTVTQYTAPTNSKAEDAQNAMTTYFGSAHSDDTTVILIDTAAGDVDVLTPAVEAFSGNISVALAEYGSFVDSVEGYFMLASLPLLADEFVSTDNTATFITILTDPSSTEDTNDFLDWLQRRVDEFYPGSPYRTRLTGQAVFAKDIVAGVESDMAHMDSIVLPLALCVLATILRNARLMILPILSLLGALGGSFAIMYPISEAMSVISFAPSMQMSTSLAIGIDQNLFLLSRFRDEIERGVPVKTAVGCMLQNAGHTVLVSGSTLMLCFLSLIFFPMDLMRSVGCATALSILFTIAVNLTLLPAMLLTFDRFFTDFSYGGLGCIARLFVRRDELARYRAPSMDDARSSSRGSRGSTDSPFNLVLSDFDAEGMSESLWYRLGRAITTRKAATGVIVLVLAFCLPVCAYCFDIQRGDSLTLLTPRGVTSTEAFASMSTEFGAGAVFPYQLLVVPPSGTAVLSEEYFATTQGLISTLVADVDNTAAGMFTGATWLSGAAVPFADMVTALAHPAATDSYNQTLQALYASTVSPEGASYCTLALDIDPYGQDGITWLYAARTAMDAYTAASGGYAGYLVDGASVDIDAVDAVFDELPTMISVTLALVFLLVGAAFRSVAAPLRSIFSLALTLSWVYGLTALTYQYGVFDWLSTTAVSDVGEVSWFCVPMCFPIILGLATDYDVFLISRATEIRALGGAGKTDRDAIVEALFHTGSIITAAGVIMAVAFSGLLLSTEIILNQMAFMLVMAVLLDTFVIRSLFVPAVFCLMQPYNWWPRKFTGALTAEKLGYNALSAPPSTPGRDSSLQRA